MILNDFAQNILSKLNNIISNQNDQNTKLENIDTNIINNTYTTNAIHTLIAGTDDTPSTTGSLNQRLAYLIEKLENSSSSNNGYTSGMKTFTSSGTFIVPDGVNRLLISGIGAGGGGGGGYTSSYAGGGGGGGSGEWAYRKGISVNSGESIQITIGTGGNGGSGGYPGGTGTQGSITSVGTYLTLQGGYGGTGGQYEATAAGGQGGGEAIQIASGGIGYSNGGTGYINDFYLKYQDKGKGSTGGIGAAGYKSSLLGGGGGGATGYQVGGTGGGTGQKSGSIGYAGGIGAGGGGGSGGGYAGGKGGNGIVIIEW